MATTKKKSKPLVGILMGSDSDFPVMEEASKILEKFGVAHEVLVTSAHRTPERTREYVKDAEKRGVKILIAGAGAAAHLAGVIAAETLMPVIGVPIGSTSLQGLDALLSTVQMPGGVSVPTMAIGRAGARNAGILATQMLALQNKTLVTKLRQYRKEQAKAVIKKSKNLASPYAKDAPN